MKLQNKLFLLFAISTIIILIVIGGILYKRIWNERLNSINNIVTNQLDHLDFAVNSFMIEVENDINELSENEIIQTKEDSNFTNFLTADEKSFIYNISDTEQKIIDILNNHRINHPYVNSVYMGRENGSFVRSHKRELPTQYDPRNRPWYILAKNNPSRVMITEVYPSVTTSDVNIGFVKALSDDNGKI